MRKLMLVLAVATAMAALALPATVGAKVSYGSQLKAFWFPGTDVPGAGSFKGEIKSGSSYCTQRRKVELFLAGKKVGSGEGDRYGNWYISFPEAIEPGSYVAKVAKTTIPGKPVKTCKAAQSKPVTVG